MRYCIGLDVGLKRDSDGVRGGAPGWGACRRGSCGDVAGEQGAARVARFGRGVDRGDVGPVQPGSGGRRSVPGGSAPRTAPGSWGSGDRVRVLRAVGGAARARPVSAAARPDARPLRRRRSCSTSWRTFGCASHRRVCTGSITTPIGTMTGRSRWRWRWKGSGAGSTARPRGRRSRPRNVGLPVASAGWASLQHEPRIVMPDGTRVPVGSRRGAGRPA